MREKKASFCTEADGTPTAENKIKETEREVITMTKNFTPAKADTQRPRLSKEEYAEKKRVEKDGVYQLADEAVKECENIIIRLERENEYHEVENLVRESFWNVYRPVCLEHYVLKEIFGKLGLRICNSFADVNVNTAPLGTPSIKSPWRTASLPGCFLNCSR